MSANGLTFSTSIPTAESAATATATISPECDRLNAIGFLDLTDGLPQSP
jgi:hypothetical protein